MKLSELLSALPLKQILGEGDPDIGGIFQDSRQVAGNSLFVAIPGLRVDGRAFIPEAIRRGAAAVVAERSVDGMPEAHDLGVPVVIVPNARRALAFLSAALQGFPARKLKVVGITGTDGKTTTSFLVSAILEAAGHSTGVIGTVDFKIGQRLWSNETGQSTPEAPAIQELLAEMVAEGMDFAIIESTSHALVLDRVAACEYDAAVFTNLTAEHLDFHRDVDQYLQAKSRLFTLLGESIDKGIPKTAVLNADDRSFDFLRQVAKGRVVSYGIDREADFRADDIRLSGTGTSFRLTAPAGQVELTTRLLARYNVYNALAAIALCSTLGVTLDVIQRCLADFSGVSGRWERVDHGQPFAVFVDFAHTPAAMEKSLTFLRSQTAGRVLLVFGCPGERDELKRPAMGELAARLSEFFVITTDTPHHEEPGRILDQVEAGAKQAGAVVGTNYEKLIDRFEAIRLVLARARPGDAVLIAGRGHEKYIDYGHLRVACDDREVVREILRRKDASLA
ncbi:MAG: UDP-N-acetylmuramoyl-L-alanyl-D-glutamate--2,6-diaminopimelate ligase [Dehalococcoidia bacterium]|nr:UDP-N-acetylmuramoyl-L-alanyl-D-glutamate--2,6-diaminopimelate ligase [Dehalococcoidia bacterium]